MLPLIVLCVAIALLVQGLRGTRVKVGATGSPAHARQRSVSKLAASALLLALLGFSFMRPIPWMSPYGLLPTGALVSIVGQRGQEVAAAAAEALGHRATSGGLSRDQLQQAAAAVGSRLADPAMPCGDGAVALIMIGRHEGVVKDADWTNLMSRMFEFKLSARSRVRAGDALHVVTKVSHRDLPSNLPEAVWRQIDERIYYREAPDGPALRRCSGPYPMADLVHSRWGKAPPTLGRTTLQFIVGVEVADFPTGDVVGSYERTIPLEIEVVAPDALTLAYDKDPAVGRQIGRLLRVPPLYVHTQDGRTQLVNTSPSAGLSTLHQVPFDAAFECTLRGIGLPLGSVNLGLLVLRKGTDFGMVTFHGRHDHWPWPAGLPAPAPGTYELLLHPVHVEQAEAASDGETYWNSRYEMFEDRRAWIGEDIVIPDVQVMASAQEAYEAVPKFWIQYQQDLARYQQDLARAAKGHGD